MKHCIMYEMPIPPRQRVRGRQILIKCNKPSPSRTQYNLYAFRQRDSYSWKKQ